jgi:hypothetical protein
MALVTVETTKLNNGRVVLARTDRHGYFGAVTYTNDAQAQRKVENLAALGVLATVYVGPWSRIRFIAID